MTSEKPEQGYICPPEHELPMCGEGFAGEGGAEVGSCDLCGQKMIRTADDCWHPWNVTVACPAQPEERLGATADGDRRWREFYAAGLRTGRPGRDHFLPAGSLHATIRGMVRLAGGLGYALPWATLLDACAGIGTATQVRSVVDDLIDQGVIETTPAGLRTALLPRHSNG